MIQIYKPDNTNYNRNGDITLLPSSASVHVILNGAWTAELTHPIDPEGRWKYITEESVIKIPSFNGDQLFRIKNVQKQDSGITASMEPIFYDAMGDCWLKDIRPTAKNGQEALDIMLAPNEKYSGQSNITKATTAYYENVNFLEALNGDIDQSFINRWGGEILFDNFTVIVNTRVGGDYGVELRYGKNIPQDGMSEETDTSEIITRIYPKAYNGRTITGNLSVDSPLINAYPTVKTVEMEFDDVKLVTDLQGDAEDTDIVCDAQEELDAALTQKCNEQYDAGVDKPIVTINADMVLLQNTEQYKDVQMLESVSLGDTVHCINNRLGITTNARIIELEYDSVRKKVSSVVIGDFKGNYFDKITSSAQKIDSVINADGSVMAEKVQGILNGIYTQLRLQSTAAQPVEGDAFKVENLDEDSPLYGAMVWGTQGIQISTTRTADGKDWDWTTAVTANGIVANAIITGILSDKTGTNWWNLDTGEFRMTSAAFQIDGESIDEYIADRASSSGSLVILLSNDFSGVATDANGGDGNYSECYTTVSVMLGASDVTDAAEIIASASDGIVGSWDVASHTYTVSNMTTDNGTVTFHVNYNNVMLSKVFTIVKNKQGSQGVPGPSGENGETLYTWIKYADTPTSGMSDSPDGKEYIGIAYNKTSPTESSNYSDYQWSKYVGSDGIPGAPGEDGQSLYTWVKYATSATGANMSDDPTGKTYLGLAYNKTTAAESNNPSDYTWAFFEGPQGPKGEQGIRGPAGADGRTSYFHVKYSANSNGNPMSETPNTYIGTYVDFTETDSTDYRDYTWSRFEGTQGIPGTNGTNGRTSYLHIKYSNDGGATFTANGGETPGDYIGQYVDFTQADSTDPDDYTWSLTKGADGADGRVYMVVPSVQTMVLGADNKFTPSEITFSAYYRDGTSATRRPYSGRFILTFSTDGETFNTRYTSAQNESSFTIPISSPTTKVLRCTLYAAGGTTTALDQQTVSVVKDIDNLTQEEVFNILTNNGAMNGLFMSGGQLYVNASYIRSGTLVLGGSGNSNGTLSLRNASNSQIALLNNTGLSIYAGGRIFVGNSNNSGNATILTNGSLDFYRDNVQMARVSSDNYADGSVGFSIKNYSGTDFVQFVNNSTVWMRYVPKSGSISGVQVDANTLYTFCNLHLQNTIDLSSAQITASPLRINGNTVTDFITGSSTYSDGGRIELAGGILIQWDAAVFGSSGFATVDFPVAYSSTTSYIILASPQYANSFVGAAFSTSRQSASRAYIYIRNVDGGIISGGGGVNWLAIGIKA